MKISEKNKKVLYYFGLFISAGSFVISIIALVALFFGEYGFWKWFSVITNTTFFGIASWFFYYQKIKK